MQFVLHPTVVAGVGVRSSVGVHFLHVCTLVWMHAVKYRARKFEINTRLFRLLAHGIWIALSIAGVHCGRDHSLTHHSQVRWPPKTLSHRISRPTHPMNLPLQLPSLGITSALLSKCISETSALFQYFVDLDYLVMPPHSPQSVSAHNSDNDYNNRLLWILCYKPCVLNRYMNSQGSSCSVGSQPETHTMWLPARLDGLCHCVHRNICLQRDRVGTG